VQKVYERAERTEEGWVFSRENSMDATLGSVLEWE
jgi:hypothetical protein